MPAITRARAGRLTIGTLSAQTGCNVETIRYYERIGLLVAPARSEGGLYGAEDRRRLGSIRRSRALGFTPDEVRALLRLVDGGYTCGEVRALTLAHLAGVRARIEDLRRIERVLARTAAACNGAAAPRCPIIDCLADGP